MNKTSYYNLNLPDDSDFFDIEHLNENAKKIDSELKQKDINLEKHTDNETIHLTEIQKLFLKSLEKIGTMPDDGFANVVMVEPKYHDILDTYYPEFSFGSLSQLNIIDLIQIIKEWTKGDFDVEKHATNSIVSENGIHGMRYYNEKFQVFNGSQWVDVIEELEIPFCVNTNNTNVTITVTDGVDTFTASTTKGYADFTLPRYATWTVTLKDNNTGLSKSTTVNITSTVYTEIDLDAFVVTFNCYTENANYGDTVYVKNSSGAILQSFILSSNFTSFKVYETGAIYVSIRNSDGVLSKSTGFNVISNNNNQTINVNFNYNQIHLIVDEDIDTWNDEDESGFEYTITGTDSEGKTFTLTGYDTLSCDVIVPALSGATNFTVTIGCKNYTKTFFAYVGDTIETTFYKTFTAKWVNGDTHLTYADDSTPFTRGSENWLKSSIFEGIKQVLVDASGNEYTYNAYEDDDGYAQITVDGLTSYNSDTHRFMTKIPAMGYKFGLDSNTMTYSISLTRDLKRASEGFIYDAFKVNGVMKDYLYLGQFLSHVSNSKLGSFYGVYPNDSLPLSTFRTYAKNIGTNWGIMNGYAWTLIQCLFLMYFGAFNSQYALGTGCCSEEDIQGNFLSSLIVPTGKYGTWQNAPVSFLGLVDIWGNLFQLLDGVSTDTASSMKNVYLTNSNNSEHLADPTKDGSYKTNKYRLPVTNGYCNQLSVGDNMILPLNNGGSSSTGYYDHFLVAQSGTKICVGGYYDSGTQAGIFCMRNNISGDNVSNSGVGARLMYHK